MRIVREGRKRLQKICTSRSQTGLQQFNGEPTHLSIVRGQSLQRRCHPQLRHYLAIRLIKRRQRRQSLNTDSVPLTHNTTNPPQQFSVLQHLITTMHQNPLRSVSPPAVRTSQPFGHFLQCHPIPGLRKELPQVAFHFRRVAPREIANLPRITGPAAGRRRKNSVDTTAIAARVQVHLPLIFRRNPFGMLNHRAVHVSHPDGTIRTGPQHRGAKPVVRRRQKLGLLFVRRAHSLEHRSRCIRRRQYQSRDQVVHRFGRQRIAVKFSPQQSVPINHGATRRCEPIGKRKVVETRQRATQRKHGCRPGNCGHRRRYARHAGMRVARHVTLIQHILPDGIGIVITEPVTKVVPLPPELRRATHSLNRIRLRMNSQVLATQIDRLPRERTRLHFPGNRAKTGNQPTTVTVRKVQPAIQPPPQSVHTMLLVAFHKPTIQQLLHVGLIIPRRVLCIQHHRRHTDDRTALPALNSARPCQFVQKGHGLIKDLIAIRILQNSYPPATSIVTSRIVAHFHHPQSPSFVPVKSHRVSNQRFRCRQNHTQARSCCHRIHGSHG